jgi:hypothetical protein
LSREGLPIATPPGDEAGFASGVRALFDDSDAAARVGVTARETGVRFLEWECYAGRIHELVVTAADRGAR